MATATVDRSAGTRRISLILWRSAVLLGGLLAAILVLRAGADGWLAGENPVVAARWAPGKARAAMAAARSYVGRGKVADPQVRRLVADALDGDATLPSAIELAALEANEAGDHGKAARLFHLSDAISRRSLPTRLWLIQTSVDRGDVAGALRDFDIALRTSTDAPKLLFPVLARASDDPTLVAPIARLLDRPSDWRLTFLRDAVTDYGAAPGIAAVTLRMRDRSWLIANQIDETVIGELIAQDRYAEARVVQDAFHPITHDEGLIRDPAFADDGARYPFGWRIEEQGEIGARRSRANGRSVLTYQSLSDGSGPVATQLLILPPGRYRLVTRTALHAADETAVPFWTVTCAEEGGPQITLLDQPQTGLAEADFVTPPDCGAQWLTLNLRGSDRPDGQSGAIADVVVARR
jgi:hypothetical protein